VPLDPQVESIMKEDKERNLPPYNRLTPSEARRQMLELSPPVDPELIAKRVRQLKIPGDSADIPIRLYYPDGNPPFAVAVYFHGGGWVMGNLDTHHAICHALSHTSGCLVLAVDYRLSPEHKFPAAIEDAYTATCWVAENGGSVQADANRMAVMGESAGATLATVAAMMIRDRGGPHVALQVLVYPVTNRDMITLSHTNYAQGYMLTHEMMRWFWDQYLTGEEAAEHPYVSPLRAENLGDLPPALVVTAEYDPLCDEGEAYASKLAAAGVRVRHSRYEGMVHGFFRMTARVDRSREALGEVAVQLRKALQMG